MSRRGNRFKVIGLVAVLMAVVVGAAAFTLAGKSGDWSASVAAPGAVAGSGSVAATAESPVSPAPSSSAAPASPPGRTGAPSGGRAPASSATGTAAGHSSGLGAASATPGSRQVATSTRTIGRSVEGREITATSYGDPAASRVVVIIGVIHGTETAGQGVTDRLARLGAAPGTRLWVVPDVNPDGTRRGTRQNAHGVDLNRNTPDSWQPGPRGTNYPGAQAASEPETRAYMQFLTDVRPDLVLIFHQHLDGVDSYGAKDSGLLESLSRAFGLSIKSFNCSGVCRGTLTGWFNSQFPGSAVTIELPASVTAQQASRIAAGIRAVAAQVRDAG